jgi:hypothetical protein
MTLAFTIGGILRCVNTVGASWALAVGDYFLGVVLAGIVLGSIWLEGWEPEPPESP